MAHSSQPCQLATLLAGLALLATAWGLQGKGPQTAPSVSCVVAVTAPPRHIAGKTLAEWGAIMQTRDHSDPDRSTEVPGLLALVQDDSLPWFVRRNAALTLGRWGEPAVPAIPVLVKLVEERHTVNTPDDPEAITALWALKGLALFGARAAPAAPTLRHVALDASSSVSVRLAAIDGLSRIGPTAPTVIPTLLELLSSSTHEAELQHTLRRAAMEALGMQRAVAAAATPVLTQALDDPDPVLRREAAAALGQIGPAAGQAEAGLWERFLFDDDPTVCDAAGKALVQLGPQTLPTFLQLLEEGDPGQRARALTLMAGFGPSAIGVIPTLLKGNTEPDAAVRIALAEAVQGITRQPQPAAEMAIDLLTHDDRGVRRRAYRLLQALGPQVAVVREQLGALAQHPDRTIRSAVARLQEQMRPTP